jgi:hypothetical protein
MNVASRNRISRNLCITALILFVLAVPLLICSISETQSANLRGILAILLFIVGVNVAAILNLILGLGKNGRRF